MIKELSDKFGETTIDFKCIIKKNEVIVFMMPVIENGKDIKPLKFIGTPQTIDKQIRDAIESMDDHIVNSISDYTSFAKSIEKAKQNIVKKSVKKKETVKKTEPTTPSLF